MKPAVRIVQLIAASLLSSGCVTTYTISDSDVATTPSVERVRLGADGATRESVVYTRADRVHASRFVVSGTTMTIQNGQETTTRIPLDDVERVVFLSRGDGAVQGTLAGLAVAVALGIAVGVSFDGSGDGGSGWSWGLVASGAASSVTVPVGALAGALIGHRRQYLFDGSRR